MCAEWGNGGHRGWGKTSLLNTGDNFRGMTQQVLVKLFSLFQTVAVAVA